MPDDNETRIRRLEKDVRDDRDKLHGRVNSLGEQMNASMGNVDTKLTRIETILSESIVKRIDENKEDIEKIEGKFEISIHGTDEKIGIKGQVDRLNQWSGTVKWVGACIATGTIGLLIKAAWSIITKTG